MKCEICGAEAPRESYLADFDTPLFGLCPDHYTQVKDFIEGLKPRRNVWHQYGSYYIKGQSAYSFRDLLRVTDDRAEALYAFMEEEKHAGTR